MVSCQSHLEPLPVIPRDTYSEYYLFVDDSLPVQDVANGAKDWQDVAAVKFRIETVSHNQAMAYVISGGFHGPYVVLVNTDLEPNWDPCPRPDLACYQFPGMIFFNSQYTGELWDRVPAHELGHAMGLEHQKKGIMYPIAEQGTAKPTTEDADLLIAHLKGLDGP